MGSNKSSFNPKTARPPRIIPYKRMVFVCNPHSTRAKKALKSLSPQLQELSHWGLPFVIYSTKSPNFDINVEALFDFVEDGDLAVSVGGDATASMVINASIKAKIEKGYTVFATALPFGNFSDIAANFGCRNIHDILNGRVAEFWPLACTVDGELWRYGVEYVSVGLYAEACELFDEKDVREAISKVPILRTPMSAVTLATWWQKVRGKRFLANFNIKSKKKTRTKRQRAKGASNYLAINGRSVARVLGGTKNRPDTFKHQVGCPDRPLELLGNMIEGILFRLPGEESRADTITFDEAKEFTVQADGEYESFTAKTIEIRKANTFVPVIQRQKEGIGALLIK